MPADLNCVKPNGFRFDWIRFLPWAIIGLLVVIGGFTVLAAGLPFETKQNAEMRDRLLTQQIVGNSRNIQTVTETLDRVVEALNRLSTAVARNNQQFEDMRAEKNREGTAR